MANPALQISAPPENDLRQTDLRMAERFRVLMPGSVTILDGVFDCAIEDVSQSGARFITDVSLTVGQEGILQCTPLEVLFSVVWTDGNTAGVQFEEEVALGTIRELRWHNDRFRNQYDSQLSEIVQDWASQVSADARGAGSA